MAAVAEHARAGGQVLGICNGFQILCEAGLLPGALMRNAGLRFLSRPVWVRVEASDTPFTCLYERGEVLELPIAHGDGRYAADPQAAADLEARGQVVWRYVRDNPNGSTNDIAGICNARSEEHTPELQSPCNLACRLPLAKNASSGRRAPPSRARGSARSGTGSVRARERARAATPRTPRARPSRRGRRPPVRTSGSCRSPR